MRSFYARVAALALSVGIFTVTASAQETQGFSIITEEEFKSELPTNYTSWSSYKGVCKVSHEGGFDTWNISMYAPKISEANKYQFLQIIDIHYATKIPLTIIHYEAGPATGATLDLLKMYLKKDGSGKIQKLDFMSQRAYERIQRLLFQIESTLATRCRDVFDERLKFLESIEKN
ncbi:MAG: hypothetical protein HYT93_04850 [Parcubacteria group bacterium]|nr:hypothetical protein [Parcubacteria group bacterium]